MIVSGDALVDFHCHLDLGPSLEDQIRQSDAEEIVTLAVTTTPRAWLRNRVAAVKSKTVRAAIGLHPELIADRVSEAALLERYLPESRYVGEVGLDGRTRHRGSLPAQQRIFNRVLSVCGSLGNRVISIHSAGAAPQVLDCLSDHLPNAATCRFVLHWFTGTQKDLERAVDIQSIYFSVNLQMLSSERSLKLLGLIPVDRVLTETDFPFANPGVSRKDCLLQTIDGLARIHSRSPSEMRRTILNNLKSLVR